VLVIFCVTDERIPSTTNLTAATIGLTVTLLIFLISPLTMACLIRRAIWRRVSSSLAGWRSVPFQANGHGWLTVYLIAPLSEACSSGIYRSFFAPDTA
jgi:glycerol uptake facilitator protein